MTSAPDRIFSNGKLYTINPENPWAEAIAIANGKIVAIGSNDEILKLAGPQTDHVDLDGKMAMPGLIDNHIHIVLGGQIGLFDLKFPPTINLEGLLALVREKAGTIAEDQWIIGNQWGANLITELSTSRALAALDEASQGRPVMLRDETAHNRWINTRAMQLAGITETTPAPEMGSFGRDTETGRLNGIMVEAAAGLIEQLASKHLTPKMAEDAIRYSVKLLNSVGVTSFQEAASVGSVSEALKVVDEMGDLTTWVVTSMPLVEPPVTPGESGEPLLSRRDTFKSRHVHPTYAKIFLDGVPVAMTAAFHDPYLPSPAYPMGHRGDTIISMPELIRWVDRCEELGLGLKVHCAGDASVTCMLDAVQAVRHFRGPPKVLHHIAHASYIRDSDIPRFAELQVVADLCPIAWFPSTFVEGCVLAMGKERAERWWPIKSLKEAGALMAGGTDWPVVTVPDPWTGIEAFVTRENPDGSYPGVKLWAEQAIDLETALEIYTINAARAMGIDALTGSLQVGKSADMIVLERNIFEIPIREVSKNRVLQTYFEGRIVHQAIAEQ